VIRKVRSAGIYVKDQERARDFWTEKLGFELVMDAPMHDAPGASRWLEVRAPGDDMLLVLFTPEGQADRIGGFSNVIFECADVEATYRELTERGVEFKDTPRKEPWGWWAAFNDPDGNHYGLTQPGG
jgi:lactoylglutathione lyase